jgi:hypothetical protein
MKNSASQLTFCGCVILFIVRKLYFKLTAHVLSYIDY